VIATASASASAARDAWLVQESAGDASYQEVGAVLKSKS
jgi:hypothetical protein